MSDDCKDAAIEYIRRNYPEEKPYVDECLEAALAHINKHEQIIQQS